MASEEQGGTGEQWQDTEDWQLNAILPHAQMASSEMGYIWGYEQAVGALTAAAYHTAAGNGPLLPGTYVMVDTILFPLVFSARHYLELSLKHFTRTARTIGKDKAHVAPMRGHELNLIFKEAVAAVETYVPRSLPYINKLEGLVAEFHALDPGGDALRYALSTGGTLHLAHIGVVNIQRFQAWFDHLKLLVKDVFLALDYDEEEMASGTATKDYDRSELRALAKRLPPCDSWNTEVLDPFFDEEKVAKPSLSRRRFNEATKRIRTTPWLSILVGKELVLSELSGGLFERLVTGNGVITEEEWGALYCLYKIGGSAESLEYFRQELSAATKKKQASRRYDMEEQTRHAMMTKKEIAAERRLLRQDPTLMFHNGAMSIYYCEAFIRSHVSSHAFIFCRGLERLGQPTLLKGFREACDTVGLSWSDPPPNPPRNWPKLPFEALRKHKTVGSVNSEHDGEE